MQLGLTIPLQRFLKIKNLVCGESINQQYCWDLHIISLRGRSSLLAVHCVTRYTFTMFDLSLADWQTLPQTFFKGLLESLHSAGITDDEAKQYVQATGEMELARTHGRRTIAFLNRAWEDVLAMDITLDPTRQHQPLLDISVNGLLRRCAGLDGLGTASERLRNSLHTEGTER